MSKEKTKARHYGPEKSDSILLEAENLVNGERDDQYGDCVAQFERYAEIASLIGKNKLSPADIVNALIAVKLGREAYKHKRDNLTDLCGYAEIKNRIENATQN